MKCPTCSSRMNGSPDACAVCGCNLRVLDLRIGSIPKHLPGSNDHAGLMSFREEQALNRSLARFREIFPQSGFHVFGFETPQNVGTKEFAYWLFNRCSLDSASARGGRNFSILLLIDPKKKSAALVAGYGCEQFSTDDDWEAILQKAAPCFQKEKWLAGIHSVKNQIERLFKVSAKQLWEHPSKNQAR